ncbi:MAG: HAMP domain-containing sensor histidine kinase [Acidobacteriota bacterium]|jgi:signal transduction histidine kinase
MSYIRSNRLQLGAIIVLAGLLVVLALFQYSWLGQLSERERERMLSTLRWATSAARFEFDLELADLYRQFQVDYSEEQPFVEQIAARYADRVATLEGPDILERIYWVRLDDDGLTLQEFTGLSLVTLPEWPPDIAPLREQFKGQLRYNDAQFELPLGPQPLQDDIPALVIQQLWTRPLRTLPEYRSISWIIAKLDHDVIVNELIPELIAEHIYAEGGPDYNVGVTRIDDPSKLIYSSAEGLTAASFANPDAERDMFALRIWHFNQRIRTNRRIWSVVEEVSAAKWNLVVKHQAGSLEAAVSLARNRSLAVSLGVLVLLGGAIAMIVLSTRRAQRLAEQQMEFVAGVSHELRTPLAVIRAAAENLADDVVHDADRTRQYGELINREGRRLSNMVERVLLFAKMRSGNVHFQRRPVDLLAAIEDAIAANKAWAEEGDIKVARELPESLPSIYGDPPALASVLQNLLSNALKYSRRGGQVTIQARAVKSGDGDAVQIAIHDQGAGIPGHEIPHVFEPFYRGKRARDTQVQGSGLGLSLVKQVVEGHGGSVEVVSTPGAGSTFLVQLPVGEPDDETAPALR